MLQLPGEKFAFGMPDHGLMVSNYRVRSTAKESGNGQMTSIMLDAVSSCRITHTSHPGAVIVAVLCFLAAGFFGQPSGSGEGMTGLSLLAGLFLLVYYFATRRQVLEIESSGGASICVELKGLQVEKTSQIIDLIEHERAKYTGLGNIAAPQVVPQVVKSSLSFEH